MRILRYTPADRERWDRFVDSSRNGTFLLKRGYMEYHSDRFEDFSLIVETDGGEIAALFPASMSGDTVTSHGGLTYGGLVLGYHTSGSLPLTLLPALSEWLSARGVATLIYKPVPHIYHSNPCEEDLYALFRCGASLSVRNLATVIDMRRPVPSSRLGKRAEKRRRRFGIAVQEVESAAPFWDIIVEDRRVRHNTVPVHTCAELDLLKSRFPDNIRFFVAVREADGSILGGAVIYLDRGVIHLQYAACTPEGKELYATDVIYHDLIFNRFPLENYFDFGTSNEQAGRYLNCGMVAHKEEFGGRSVVYDTYRLDLPVQ